MAGFTVSITVSVVFVFAGLQLAGPQTLPFAQDEAVLARVAVVEARSSAGATRSITGLALLSLLVHEETRTTVIHAVSIGHVEAFSAPVALRVVTVLTVLVVTWFTLTSPVHAVSPIRARLMTLGPELIIVVFTFETHSGVCRVRAFTLFTAVVAGDTGLALRVGHFTFGALQGHTLSKPGPEPGATVHTVKGRGAGHTVLSTGLTAAPGRGKVSLRTRQTALALEQEPLHTMDIGVAAGAVVGPRVGALLTGVVTRGALSVQGVAPPLAADHTAAGIEKPC